MSRSTTIGLALLLLALPHAASAQGAAGRVEDESGAAVSAAVVTLLDGDEIVAWALTGDDGSYNLQALDPGEYTVAVEAAGYTSLTSPPLDLAFGQTVALRFELPVDPVLLAPVAVTVERSTRLERHLERLGLDPQEFGSRVITRADIEARPTAEDVGVAIEWKRINGVRVMRAENYVRGSTPVLCVTLVRGRRGDASNRCVLTVLDGAVIGIDAAAMIPPHHIEGMILLGPVEATRLYGSAAGGGALLMFTRDGPS